MGSHAGRYDSSAGRPDAGAEARTDKGHQRGGVADRQDPPRWGSCDLRGRPAGELGARRRPVRGPRRTLRGNGGAARAGRGGMAMRRGAAIAAIGLLAVGRGCRMGRREEGGARLAHGDRTADGRGDAGDRQRLRETASGHHHPAGRPGLGRPGGQADGGPGRGRAAGGQPRAGLHLRLLLPQGAPARPGGHRQRHREGQHLRGRAEPVPVRREVLRRHPLPQHEPAHLPQGYLQGRRG